MNAHAGASQDARLEPDVEQVRTFFDALFRHADPHSFVSLRAFDDERDDMPALFTIGIACGDKEFVQLAVEYMRQAANHPRPHVFCPPVATFAGSRKASASDLANGVAMSVECDAQPNESRRILTNILGEPTVVVASGGEWLNETSSEIEPKLHLHWRLSAATCTAAQHAALREARQLATKVVAADASNIAVVHPIRWPGSWHRKGKPRLATIVALSDHEIDLETALAALRRAAGIGSGEGASSASEGRFSEAFARSRRKADHLLDVAAALTVIANDNLSWDDWNRIGMATWVASDGASFPAFDAWSRQSAKYDQQTTWHRWAHYSKSPPGRIGAGTLFYLAQQAHPGWTKPSETRRPHRPGEQQDRGEPGSTFDTRCADFERVVIRVIEGELPRAADEAEQALLTSELPIFVRAGALVRPVVETVPASRGRWTTIAKFGGINADAPSICSARPRASSVSTAAEKSGSQPTHR